VVLWNIVGLCGERAWDIISGKQQRGGSVRKFDRGKKTGPHRFRRFLENSEKSVKFGKIQPKRTGDDRGIVKTGKTEIRPVSSINRPVFPENWRGNFRTNFARNQAIFAKNQ
jgi:hypothetical protein